MSPVRSRDQPTEGRPSRAATTTGPATPADQAPRALLVVRRVGFALLGVQLAGFLAESVYVFRHFALTWDFALYSQAWWLIGHGHLTAFDTTLGGPFWGHHGEAIVWPLALLTAWLPAGPTMLALQDVAVVAAEAVAFQWAWTLIARRRLPALPSTGLAACLLVALLLDPWTWWSIAQDFHVESFMALFAILTAHALAEGRSRWWVWAVLLLACGDVAATLAVGIGLSAVAARGGGRDLHRQGAALIVAGVAWAVAVVALGGDQSHTLAQGYGYVVGPTGNTHSDLAQIVAGAITHPGRLLDTLWQHRLDVYGSVAVLGAVGILTPWGAGVPVVTLLANNLNRYQGGVFAAPGYQGLPITGFLVVGLATILAWAYRRSAVLAWVLVVAVAANAVGWAAVWMPRTNSQWVRVSRSAEAVLERAVAGIPRSAEVIASQGVAGRFAGRAAIYPYRAAATFPIRAATVFFVLTAYQGVETVDVDGSLAAIGAAVSDGASLVDRGGGVWVLRWTPPPGVRSVSLPGRATVVPGWVLESDYGTPAVVGPVSTWHMAAHTPSGGGYLVYGAYWHARAGAYRATVTAVTSEPVNVEVWDDDGSGQLLGRVNMLGTGTPITVPVTVPAAAATPFSGTAPFVIAPLAPPAGALVEVRVWAPGDTTAAVYSVALRPATPGT